MSRLSDLPTTFLEANLRANPETWLFSWGNTRLEMENELWRREIYEAAKPLFRPPINANVTLKDALTVVIFTSPIPSNPSDWIIENVHASIRNQLPDVRIVILADGGPGSEFRVYGEYKDTLRAKGREVVEFKEHCHETLMLKRALRQGVIKTPLLLVGEHDWGIRPLFIDWQGIAGYLLDGSAKYKVVQIRQGEIGDWEKSGPLRLGNFALPVASHGIVLLPTVQFQCPMHMARYDWYCGVLDYISCPQVLEGPQMGDVLFAMGAMAQMACYLPEGKIARLYHLDGREATGPYEVEGMFKSR